MATQIKPTTKNSPAVKVGRNRDNKPADDYAPPHTMSGKKVEGWESGTYKETPYATDKAAKNVEVADPIPNGVSYGMAKEKRAGIKMRGTGAATKGTMSRGPMA